MRRRVYGMITCHKELIQGSDEWLEARRGILTASEMKLIITPSNLKPANNKDERAHLYELLAQRITGYAEPQYISDDMLRGMTDEIEARELYAKNYAPVDTIGFITNDRWGFKIGFSPDGVVGEDGLIECKSRRQKFQIECILKGEMPDDYLIQVQTGLLVSEREWCDFISYSAGLPMITIRVFPDGEIQHCILEAAKIFEDKLKLHEASYYGQLQTPEMRFIKTERKPPNEGEIQIG